MATLIVRLTVCVVLDGVDGVRKISSASYDLYFIFDFSIIEDIICDSIDLYSPLTHRKSPVVELSGTTLGIKNVLGPSMSFKGLVQNIVAG